MSTAAAAASNHPSSTKRQSLWGSSLYLSKAIHLSLSAASNAFEYVPLDKVPNLPLLSVENQPSVLLNKVKGWVKSQQQEYGNDQGKKSVVNQKATPTTSRNAPPQRQNIPATSASNTSESRRSRTISSSSTLDTVSSRNRRAAGFKVRLPNRNNKQNADSSENTTVISSPSANTLPNPLPATPPRSLGTAQTLFPPTGSPSHVLPSPIASASISSEPDSFLTDVYGTPPPPTGLVGRTMSKVAYAAAWTTGKTLHKITNVTESFVHTVEPALVHMIPAVSKLAARVPGTAYIHDKLNTAMHLSPTSTTPSSSSPTSTSSSPSKLYQIRNNAWGYVSSVASSIPVLKKAAKAVDPATYVEFSGVNKSVLSHYRVNADGKQRPPLSFSFSGGAGWNVAYELGAAKCIKELIKPWLFKDMMFLGSSSGAFVAACLALDIDLEMVLDGITEAAVSSSQRLMGPISSMNDAMRRILEQYIPEDISAAQSRLFVSLTHFPSFSNTIVGHFTNRENLINYLLASSYIPLYFESPICIDGELYLDGTISESRPRLNDFTITVTSIPGRGNVSPALERLDTYSSLDALVPSSDPLYYRSLYKKGYDDMRIWLRKQIEIGVLTRLVFLRLP